MSTVQRSPHYTYYHRGSTQDIQTKTQGGTALMGGSTDVDEVFRWMADQGGNGDFLVLRGSGSDGYQSYIEDIAEVNSVSTLVIKNREAASDPFVLEKVQKAEAVFFAGGDQWNYVGKWKETPLLKELNRALLKGVPMGGTSAGLAILGEHVFSAQNNTITSEEALQDPFDPAITLESDFLETPHLQDVITDSHFSERERLGRLVTFISRLQVEQNSQSIKGIGVDEKTAVLLSPDGSSVVHGRGAAHFVKASESPTEIQAGQALSHPNLQLYSVSDGQSFDFRSWSSDDVEAQTLTVEKGQLNTKLTSR